MRKRIHISTEAIQKLTFVSVTLYNVRYGSIIDVISSTKAEVGTMACRVNEPKIFSLQKTVALQQKITVT